jgi:hypothetical protein
MFLHVERASQVREYKDTEDLKVICKSKPQHSLSSGAANI